MSPSAPSNRVTLVYSGQKGGYLHIPLTLLFLARALRQGGFQPRLVDLRVQNLTPADLEGALYLGVSHMSGSMQIPPALACARMARAAGVPVVFGGAHPSILPEQTAAHPLVDIAVKGEGEEAVVELAEHFQGLRELGSIRGIAFRRPGSGEMVFTAERQLKPFDAVTHLPYELLPMHRYLATSVDFAYQSSRGCPHRCAFCAEVALYPRTWRPKPAAVVVEEIENIIGRYNPERIFFLDSNFFCSHERVAEFCELVLSRGIRRKFFALCRFDYFDRYRPEFLRLLKRTGFTEIEFGGESGSDVTLQLIRKDITREQILAGIRKCRDAGLRSFTSFMVGFPGESDQEMDKTLEIYDRILNIDPDGARINGLFVYSPFPGTALFDEAVRNWGYRPPAGLEDWARFELYDSGPITWLDRRRKKRLQAISSLARFFFVRKSLSDWGFRENRKRHGGLLKALFSSVLHQALYPLARLRWKHRFFRGALEFELWQRVFNAYMGRK